MALKFLNKKGWHTGSLRNIENVWKAEQKRDAEQKKLEELRKQIHEERERSEFRLLQEQAGLVPKQERLDFLYESGLGVGKASSSDGFKSLEESVVAKSRDEEAQQQQKSKGSAAAAAGPGALFEEKPQSANDAWRKLHSDPLLLIRQREQEALARVKNNPVQMEMIRKSVEAKKLKDKKPDVKENGKKHKKSKHHKSRHGVESSGAAIGGEGRRSSTNHKRAKYDEHLMATSPRSENESSERKRKSYKDSKYKDNSTAGRTEGRHGSKREQENSEPIKYNSRGRKDSASTRQENRDGSPAKQRNSSDTSRYEPRYKRRNHTTELSQEERAAKLKEMQMDAELHEEHRWKRLQKAKEEDDREASRAHTSGSRNFLDATTRSVYGTENGGSSTIEESVRRRAHYSQGRSQVGEGNAFRR